MRIYSLLFCLGLISCSEAEKGTIETNVEDCSGEDCSDESRGETACETRVEECLERGGSEEDCAEVYEECLEHHDDRRRRQGRSRRMGNK